MAFESHMWLFLYRTPADDYKHLHLEQLNGIPKGDDAVKWFFTCTNIDAKIERGGPVTSPGTTEKWAKYVIETGGPEYRSLRAGEKHLTLADMENVKAKKLLDFMGLDDQPMPVPLSLQELQAKAAALSKPSQSL